MTHLWRMSYACACGSINSSFMWPWPMGSDYLSVIAHTIVHALRFVSCQAIAAVADTVSDSIRSSAWQQSQLCPLSEDAKNGQDFATMPVNIDNVVNS